MTRNLRVYTALEIILAFGALVLVTLALPLETAVGLDIPHLSPEVNPILGVAFWVVLALAGSALFVQRPEGGIVTLDLPFVVAATILGGPVAGGWVAMVGSFELRELRLPWYGALANHAMATFPAIFAGLLWLDLGGWLQTLVSFSPAAQYLVAALWRRRSWSCLAAPWRSSPSPCARVGRSATSRGISALVTARRWPPRPSWPG